MSPPSAEALQTIPGFRWFDPAFASAGQPERHHWLPLREAGFRSVICLRPDAEQPGRDEAAELASAGLASAFIPIATGADLTPAAVQRFMGVLAELPHPCLVHCASGNRVGALFALRESAKGGTSADAALALGRSAGLTGLEVTVRALMESRAP